MPEITCPSGLAGEIRKLKVKEENYLADSRKMRAGGGLNRVLASVWTQTHEAGPYSFPNGGRPDWSRVLMGDNYYAMMQMRIATYGPMFEFRTQCRSEFCRSGFEWEVDLTKLEVQQLSDESKQIYMNSNRFEMTLPSGQKLWFKLQEASIQKKYLKIKTEQRDTLMSAILQVQILEVEGVEKKRMKDWVEDLDADVASDIRQAFDDAGCGIETEIEIECPVCDSFSTIELPIESRDFFSKPKKAKKKKEEAGTAASTESSPPSTSANS